MELVLNQRSPLDSVDDHIYFSDSLNFLQQNDTEKFNAFTSTLDANTQQGLQMLVQYAQERRQKLAQAMQQANGKQ